MTTTIDPPTIENALREAEICALIDERIQAVHVRDVHTAMAHTAHEITSFDVVNPLQSVGSEAARDRAEQWFSSFQSPIGYEVRDLSITAGEDVAFSHYLYRVSGTQEGGRDIDMWVRSTICYRKQGGKWHVVHEHNSVPFDPSTGMASLTIRP